MATTKGKRIEAATVHELLERAREFPERVSQARRRRRDGWSVATYDPTLLLECYPHLSLRAGYKLAAYQFTAGGNGNGFPFVIPADRVLPRPPDRLEFGWLSSGAPALAPNEAVPEWVHGDIEAFIEGDRTPISFFEASMFAREVRELGAMWHGSSWSTHTVLTSGPPQEEGPWTWLEPEPTDWRPLVSGLPAGQASVVFFTHTGLGLSRIIRHCDRFAAGYRFATEEVVVAEGVGGYIF